MKWVNKPFFCESCDMPFIKEFGPEVTSKLNLLVKFMIIIDLKRAKEKVSKLFKNMYWTNRSAKDHKEPQIW